MAGTPQKTKIANRLLISMFHFPLLSLSILVTSVSGATTEILSHFCWPFALSGPTGLSCRLPSSGFRETTGCCCLQMAKPRQMVSALLPITVLNVKRKSPITPYIHPLSQRYRSITMAIPMPPPMHMVMRPVPYPLRRIWFMPLTICRPPVAPMGWPREMPDPSSLGLS